MYSIVYIDNGYSVVSVRIKHMCEPVASHDTTKYIYIVLCFGQRLACVSQHGQTGTPVRFGYIIYIQEYMSC